MKIEQQKYEFRKAEIELRCPCGKKLEYDENSLTTNPFKCPDRDCWIFPDNKGGVLVGQPII